MYVPGRSMSTGTAAVAPATLMHGRLTDCASAESFGPETQISLPTMSAMFMMSSLAVTVTSNAPASTVSPSPGVVPVMPSWASAGVLAESGSTAMPKATRTDAILRVMLMPQVYGLVVSPRL